MQSSMAGTSQVRLWRRQCTSLGGPAARIALVCALPIVRCTRR